MQRNAAQRSVSCGFAAKGGTSPFHCGLKVRATPRRKAEPAYGYLAPRSGLPLGPSARNDAGEPKGGSTELACGSQAFIATLLFDPSMSALPIIPKQNSVSVGLFTH
jgi:hypothetical protein